MTEQRKTLLVLALGFEPGGIVTTFKTLLPHFLESGCEVRLLAPYADEIANYDVPREMFVGAAFPRRIRNRFFSRALRAFHWLTGWRCYFACARKFPHDAFFVYGASLAPEWVRYSQKPVWGMLHSFPHIRFPRPFATVMLRTLRKFSGEYAGLFSISDPERDSWRAVGLESRVLVMPKRQSFFLPYGQVRRKRSEGRLRVVCVARLSWEKGQDLLIRAMAEAPQAELVLLGYGKWKAELEWLVESLNIRDRVTFAGWQDDPVRIIRAADLLVNSSRTEGGSLVLHEALACGVPVMATDCPGNRWSLFDGSWGRIVPLSAEGIAEGLRKACENYDWCLPEVGFDVIATAIADEGRRTEEFVRRKDWTKEGGR